MKSIYLNGSTNNLFEIGVDSRKMIDKDVFYKKRYKVKG